MWNIYFLPFSLIIINLAIFFKFPGLSVDKKILNKSSMFLYVSGSNASLASPYREHSGMKSSLYANVMLMCYIRYLIIQINQREWDL